MRYQPTVENDTFHPTKSTRPDFRFIIFPTRGHSGSAIEEGLADDY
jgi:hypothetical protein